MYVTKSKTGGMSPSGPPGVFMALLMIHLRHADAAAVIPTITPNTSGTKTDRLVLGREGALYPHSLVSILHNHRIFLNDNMVDIATSILQNREIKNNNYRLFC